MVLLWVGIGAGVLIALVLIIKSIKTSSKEVLGVNKQCKKCGMKIYGPKCPKCDKRTQFGR